MMNITKWRFGFYAYFGPTNFTRSFFLHWPDLIGHFQLSRLNKNGPINEAPPCMSGANVACPQEAIAFWVALTRIQLYTRVRLCNTNSRHPRICRPSKHNNSGFSFTEPLSQHLCLLSIKLFFIWLELWCLAFVATIHWRGYLASDPSLFFTWLGKIHT